MGTLLVIAIVFFFGGKSLSEYFFEKSVDNEQMVAEEVKEEKQEQEVQGVKIENQVSFESTNASPSPKATSEAQVEFVYPGASYAGDENGFRVYDTKDNAENVTQWYEDRIEEKDLGATSIVRTETNGKILNKLSAASPGFKIELEITSEGSGTLIKLKN